jgi:hypothetical protein
MFRLLAILAATTPALLGSVLEGESCGYFTYAPPEPSPAAVVVWNGVGWATTLQPVVLALLALWTPRRLPVLGAGMAALTLVLSGLTFVVPYNGICGLTEGSYLWTAIQVVVLVALLLARRDLVRPVPRVLAIGWTTALLITLVLSQMAHMPASSDPGCYADVTGGWAETWMRLMTAESVGLWTGVAAVGAVLAGYRGAPFLGLVLLVPGLFEPVAWYLSGAGHDCSSVLELFDWPYLIAAALMLAGLAHQPQQERDGH